MSTTENENDVEQKSEEVDERPKSASLTESSIRKVADESEIKRCPTCKRPITLSKKHKKRLSESMKQKWVKLKALEKQKKEEEVKVKEVSRPTLTNDILFF